MKTRVALLLAAVFAIALAGTSPARAAEPEGRIGGTLTATPTEVTLTSTATMPVNVAMAGDGPFTLTPSTFSVGPGETVSVKVTGKPAGRVSAAISAQANAVAGDTNGVILEVAFPTPAPWSPPWDLIVAGLVAILAVAFVARRLYLFASTHTLVRKEP